MYEQMTSKSLNMTSKSSKMTSEWHPKSSKALALGPRPGDVQKASKRRPRAATLDLLVFYGVFKHPSHRAECGVEP